MIYEDDCVTQLAQFVADHPQIKGPFETDYGFGYYPTVSYWVGTRRVHLHADSNTAFCMEIADTSTKFVRRSITEDIAAMQSVMLSFLVHRVSFESLPDMNWIADNLDHDKFILDPPDQCNPANLANWVGGHGVTELLMKSSVGTHLASSVPNPWWKFWR